MRRRAEKFASAAQAHSRIYRRKQPPPGSTVAPTVASPGPAALPGRAPGWSGDDTKSERIRQWADHAAETAEAVEQDAEAPAEGPAKDSDKGKGKGQAGRDAASKKFAEMRAIKAQEKAKLDELKARKGTIANEMERAKQGGGAESLGASGG